MSPRSLDQALSHFETAMRDLPATAPHLVPDLVLQSYLHDVGENARAVQVLLSSDVRHRAYPNARACFEAAQLALMLASDPEYDLAGAKAWVYAHRKDYASSKRAEREGLMSDLPDHLPATDFFAKRFEEMQRTWDDFAPGQGALLRQAETFLDHKPRRPDNWAGLDIATTLQHRLEGMPNPTGIKLPPVTPSALFRSAYDLLNRETHPHSSRLEPERIQGQAKGPVTFVFEGNDSAERADLAEVLTVSSVNLAMVAFSLRFHMERRS